MSKVSICIPVYNVQQYIERCLLSVLNQTYSNFELIIVNDCTPDESMKIVANYSLRDPRIKIINHERNMGLMWARRTGYEAASGDYILFLDSDDYLPENAITVLLDKALKSGADIVVGNMSYITEKGINNTRYSCELKYGNDPKSVCMSVLRWEMPHTLCGKIFSNKLFKNQQYLTYEQFTNSEDGLLFFQLIGNVNFVECVPDVVYYYYQNSSSSTQIKYSERIVESLFVFYSYRFNILSQFPELKKQLDSTTMKNICQVASHGCYRKTLNRFVIKYDLPYLLTIGNIIKYGSSVKDVVKEFIQVYFLSWNR